MILVSESTEEHESLRKNLEELLKLMLVIWCKENQAIKLVSGKSNGICTDASKEIIIQRQSGPFGFRMHGSKPVLISAIEAETPAETSGLEVGDAVVTINGINVLDKSHSEVIEIVKTGGNTLIFEVLKTSTILNPIEEQMSEEESLYCGYLWKLGGYASGIPSDKWLRRWFTLKTDNCLYYYKTDDDKQPVGAVLLLNYDVVKVDNTNLDTFRFDLKRIGVPVLHLASDTEQGAARWIDALSTTIDKFQTVDTWIEKTKRNQMLAPNAIINPDCFGYLVKLGRKSSNRRYCVLKEGSLYFYYDINSQNAFDVACLFGYKVQESSDKSKEYAFQIIPEDFKQKEFHFHTESNQDQKRWIAALEYSIKQTRWSNID